MGADKAFLEFEGRTLLARSLDILQSVTTKVYIVGSREKFANFAPVIEDIFPGCGPLAGIHAALQSSTQELNLMLAVDMPFVPREFLEYLFSYAQSAGDADVIVPRSEGKRQPLSAIYRRSFAAAAESALRAGQNRIDRLFDQVRTRVIEQSEFEAAGFSPNIFRNLNTPEEVAAARRTS